MDGLMLYKKLLLIKPYFQRIKPDKKVTSVITHKGGTLHVHRIIGGSDKKEVFHFTEDSPNDKSDNTNDTDTLIDNINDASECKLTVVHYD